ncbi:MAG: class I SAM-dependent methyltransferase [Bacteroidales bacterium]|nr:class I SAM-dependent methyltransferase [Bacteroidales bacterium]
MNNEKKYYENNEIWNKHPKEQELERIKTVVSLIPADVNTILDAGCGNGILVNYLLDNNIKFSRIYALDRSETALKYVKTEKSQGDISKLNFKDMEFDLVICLEVLEHLNIIDFQNAIQDIQRVAAKYIIISVPNNEKLEEHFIKCPYCKTNFHSTYHLRSFDMNITKSLFNGLGFQNINNLLIGKKESFKYISPFKRYIKKLQKKDIKFNHEVYCPACGAILKSDVISSNKMVKSQISIWSTLIKMLRNIWPKNYNYNWIFALYKRI